MVNAFQHPAHRGSQTATRVNTLPTKEGRTSLLRALPPLSQSQTRIAADALQSVELAVARPARDATEVWMAALRGGFNWSAQHTNLLARWSVDHEATTSHLLLVRSAV
jgi:hypothetical protein